MPGLEVWSAVLARREASGKQQRKELSTLDLRGVTSVAGFSCVGGRVQRDLLDLCWQRVRRMCARARPGKRVCITVSVQLFVCASGRDSHASAKRDNSLLRYVAGIALPQSPTTVSLSRCCTPIDRCELAARFTAQRYALSHPRAQRSHSGIRRYRKCLRKSILTPVANRGMHARITRMRVQHATDSCLQLHALMSGVED